jgi:hypothetical protein
VRERLAYLHLPKAAGTSIRSALSSYYDHDETVPWSFDRHLFGDFPAVADIPQPVFLGDPSEFRGYRYMEGHWSLPSILAAFEPEDVACILREPRARFLSQYCYWRSWGDEAHEGWSPFTTSLLARGPLSDYAARSEAAAIIDNLATRLILGPHGLIPADDHIAASDIDSVAAAACEQLDRIGHVDVIERGESTYLALESWFGSPLSRVRLNETDLSAGLTIDIDDLLDRRTIALLNDRSAADLQVWHHVVEQHGLDATAARTLADTAYGAALGKVAAAHPTARPSPGSAASPADATRAHSAPAGLARLLRQRPRMGRSDG